MSVIHTKIELVGNLLLRALLYTSATACTDILVNKSCILLDCNIKVTNKALNLCNLTVRKDSDLFVLSNVNHLRSKNTSRTVKCGEGLIKLSHLTADCRLLLYDVNLKACICNIKCCLNTCNTATDNEGALCNRRFTGDKGSVKVNLSNCCLTENDCLCSTCKHILVYP